MLFQAQFDASMAAPLGQSDFRGVNSCNSTVATDALASYTFVIINQHTEAINVTYSFSALTADYPGMVNVACVFAISCQIHPCPGQVYGLAQCMIQVVKAHLPPQAPKLAWFSSPMLL